jgi:hypothetical protein
VRGDTSSPTPVEEQRELLIDEWTAGPFPRDRQAVPAHLSLEHVQAAHGPREHGHVDPPEMGYNQRHHVQHVALETLASSDDASQSQRDATHIVGRLHVGRGVGDRSVGGAPDPRDDSCRGRHR